jgi:hypothetical protein
MAIATASHVPVERKLHTTRAENAAARADLDARARAGKTVQGRNRLGQFTRSVKVVTFARAANDNRRDPAWAWIIAQFSAISPAARQFALKAQACGYTVDQFRDAILLREGIDPSDPGGGSPIVAGREAIKRRWMAARLLAEAAA